MIICLIHDMDEKLRYFSRNDGKLKLFVFSYPYPFSSFIHKIRHKQHLPDHAIFFYNDERFYTGFEKYFKIQKKTHKNRTYYYIEGKKVLFKFFSEPSCSKWLNDKYASVFLNFKPWIYIPEKMKEEQIRVVISEKETIKKIIKEWELKEYEITGE